MANLIIPSKDIHKYVVGIDYGHGETSAAICQIEWDKEAGQREGKIDDIELDIPAKKKVLVSAICHHIDGALSIGAEAFEHMNNNNGIRVCFKQKPESLDGSDERLMIDYMAAVYKRVRESRDELTDTNHVVYIARPSGWVEEEAKELYCQMAIEAGIPLAGLTSESRAAIFYAKSPNVGFANEISKGAIVFDLGSSTLDFTYLSDETQPVDYGYNLGASIIDEVILEKMILSNGRVADFITKYPKYRDALKYEARRFKEEVYGRNPESRTISGFPLAKIVANDEPGEDYSDYEDIYVNLQVKNLATLNELVNSSSSYIDRIGEAIDDFKEKKILERKVNGVFLTGGASRMNFISPLISEHLRLSLDEVKIDNDNPSLTISRGIALLGTTDAITSVLVSELEKEIPSLVEKENVFSGFVEKLSVEISNQAWTVVWKTCHKWISSSKTTDENELKKELKKNLDDFQKNEVSVVTNQVLQKFLTEKSEDIRVQLNNIISRYAPGREMSSIKVEALEGDTDAIKKCLDSMKLTIAKICDSITNVVKDVLLAAIGLFLFGIFAAGYYLIKAIFNGVSSDTEKRRKKANKILDKKDDIVSGVKQKLSSELNNNQSLKKTVTDSLNSYFIKLIEANLTQVKIPIE